MLYTQLRAFHAVAAAGGFTAATKVLNVGQPTITGQVKSLEEMFNVELFHRHSRGVELSHAGKILFSFTQRLMSVESEARNFLEASGDLKIGRLNIAAVGPYHVTEVLSEFSGTYPGVKLSVTIGNTQECLARLLNYEADVGVLAQVEDDERFHSITYERHPVAVFVNTEHRFAKMRSISIKDLEGERMVLREVGSTTRRAFEEALKNAGVRIDPVMEIGSREAIWMAVQRGIGIGVVSETEYMSHPSLRLKRIRDADIHIFAHVVCLSERLEAPLVSTFFETVHKVLAKIKKEQARGSQPARGIAPPQTRN